MIAYIFGYGSLVHPEDWVHKESPGEALYGVLWDHARHFEVGINNSSSLYDHKHYLEGKVRASCIVGTLGIEPATGSQTNGIAIPVDEKLLERISLREKSYHISGDLRALWSEPLELPLFTYYPKKENRELYKKGVQQNNIFLPRSYLQTCLEGFAAYGGAADFEKWTKPPDYPLRDFSFYREDGAI